MQSSLLTLILAGLTGCDRSKWVETRICTYADYDADATCPDPADFNLEQADDDLWTDYYCGIEVREITSEGTVLSGSSMGDSGSDESYCCYDAVVRDAMPDCVPGRPYIESGAPISASPEPGAGWARRSDAGPHREALAQAWLRIAAMEHASIAAFARLTLDLLAIGAPYRLVTAAQAAAVDEAEHARLAYVLASRFAGQTLQPGPLPFDQPIIPCTDLVQLAVSAVREGCLGETVGAWLVAYAAEQATDPAVRTTLEQLARDEARHAALSWELVSWLISRGGEPVRHAVDAALQTPLSVTVGPGHPGYGILTPDQTRDLCARARQEVLLPAARALLAA